MKEFIIFVELRQLFPYMTFVYAWIVPLWSDQLLPQLRWGNLILCGYNVDTLYICMKEFVIFVCTASTEIFFSKLRSAGLNYYPGIQFRLPCTPPGQFFIGAKLFIGTPWMGNEGVLKKILVWAM